MYKFVHPIAAGVDEHDEPTLGFNLEELGMFIHDPTMDDSGRFDVDPMEEYGIPPEDIEALNQLKELVANATFNGISDTCYEIQKHLGVDDGGVAGAFWSDINLQKVRKLMFEYIELEYKLAQ